MAEVHDLDLGHAMASVSVILDPASASGLGLRPYIYLIGN